MLLAFYRLSLSIILSRSAVLAAAVLDFTARRWWLFSVLAASRKESWTAEKADKYLKDWSITMKELDKQYAKVQSKLAKLNRKLNELEGKLQGMKRGAKFGEMVISNN